MYIVNSLQEIESLVGSLTENDYINKIEYSKSNCEVAKTYAVTEDWIFTNILKQLK